MTLFLVMIKVGGTKMKGNYTFNDIFDKWLKEKMETENIKIQTYQRYEHIIDTYIREELGNVKLKIIKKRKYYRFS